LKLIVHELTGDDLEQVLRSDRRTIVEAVRPHLYRHNFAAGSLQMQIYDGVTLIAESNVVAISTIGTENYFHGYVTFLINAVLDKDTDYTFKLTSSGYTFDEGSYIGWCNGYDLGHYEATYAVVGKLTEPLDLEIWSRSAR